MNALLAPLFANKCASVKRVRSFNKHILLAFIMMVMAYMVSPLVALWEVKQAIDHHNLHKLQHYIDWTALSSSLQEVITADALGADDDLPDFGHSFAAAATSQALSRSLTPEMLLSIIDNNKLSASSYECFSIHVIGVRHVQVRFSKNKDEPYQIEMIFEHWGWKITRIDLPHEVRQV